MIFNLFKSKPSLKELIPKGFVDIHSHILPGIDDGAKNVEESLKLVTEMKKLGFSKIIGTPHTYPGLYNNTISSIKKSFNKISGKIDSGLRVSFASEYMLDSSLIEKAEKGQLLTLKDRYVLIEMSFISQPLNLFDIIFQLNLNGYKPILAHVERYIYLFENKELYDKIKIAGCKFQLNLLSSIGYYGKNVLKISDFLLKNSLIDFTGSDIHKMDHINKFNDKVKLKSVEKLIEVINNNNFFQDDYLSKS